MADIADAIRPAHASARTVQEYIDVGFIPLPDFIRGLSQAQISQIKPAPRE